MRYQVIQYHFQGMAMKGVIGLRAAHVAKILRYGDIRYIFQMACKGYFLKSIGIMPVFYYFSFYFEKLCLCVRGSCV